MRGYGSVTDSLSNFFTRGSLSEREQRQWSYASVRMCSTEVYLSNSVSNHSWPPTLCGILRSAPSDIPHARTGSDIPLWKTLSDSVQGCGYHETMEPGRHSPGATYILQGQTS
jgi:hypothetical protein